MTTPNLPVTDEELAELEQIAEGNNWTLEQHVRSALNLGDKEERLVRLALFNDTLTYYPEQREAREAILERLAFSAANHGAEEHELAAALGRDASDDA